VRGVTLVTLHGGWTRAAVLVHQSSSSPSLRAHDVV
jgi:hypothetical protein